MAGYPVQVTSCLPEYTGKAKSSMSEHECCSVAPGKMLPQVYIKKSIMDSLDYRQSWLRMTNKANVFDKTLVFSLWALE